MKRVFRQIHSNTGFSLAETLMAIMILLLVASVIGAGIPAAVSAYTKAIDAANAQTLLSTAVNALRDELTTAWGVDPDPDGSYVFYYKSSTGAKTKLGKADADSSITVWDYVRYDDQTNYQMSNEPHELVSARSVAENLCVTFGSVGFSPTDDSVLVFSDVAVKKNNTEIAKLDTFSVCLLDKDFRVPDYIS